MDFMIKITHGPFKSHGEAVRLKGKDPRPT